MLSSNILIALIVASVTLAAPLPARNSGSTRRTHRTSHSSSGNSHRTSRTSQSIHDNHQHHIQGQIAAQQQAHHNQVQAQHHAQQAQQVHVHNAVHNQGWQAPAHHHNPVNMQPLQVAGPARPRRQKKKGGCSGLGCSVMKKRELEHLEARASSGSSRRTSAVSNASSRTSQSIHDNHQHQVQGQIAAQQQAHHNQLQAQHQVHVQNAVHNQGWQAPAQPNPVNLQPLQHAPAPRPKAKSNCGLSCAIMKKRQILEAMEIEARSIEELEARELDELD